jgi:Family of unknown function (DUF6325)
MSSEERELGPIDIIVIGFPADAPQTGESVPILLDLVDRGIIRVLDVLAVRKNADGTLSGIELSGALDSTGMAELVVFEGARTGMLGDEDAAIAGEALQPGETAVLICFENTWAAPFVTAVRRNGGQLLAAQRVPAQEVIEAVNALD